MRHLAQHDPLTGLANRSLFTETLAARVADANKAGAAASSWSISTTSRMSTISTGTLRVTR